ISSAERSLIAMLGQDRLAGRRFVDVGCGSGLFSLAARRLGSTVLSFDYDPASVTATRWVKQRFHPGDDGWEIRAGSVLDRDFLASIGTFDVVYAWGVLHHTGAMFEAMGNVVPLVKRGGLIYVSI